MTETLVAHVLLDAPPPDMADVLSSIQPGRDDLRGVPLLPRLVLGVSGVEVALGAHGAPVADEGLRRDLATSAMRARLEPVVARHRAHLTVGVTPTDGDPFVAVDTWTNVLAYLLDRPDAAAVWVPAQSLVTTDVLVIGEMGREPAVLWSAVHAMWFDQQAGTALAFTAGLAALGGREVQVSGRATPAELFTGLRTAVAAELRAGRLPALGATMTMDGRAWLLAAGASVLGGGPVLQLVPAGERDEAVPSARTRKRFWPFG